MPPLAVRLLGAFSLSRNGHSLSDPTVIKGSKARALAAYLLTEKDRTHSRARIAGLFWPDMEATAARANLRQALLSLRNALETPEGPPLLQSGREKICLHPEAVLRVDLDTFLGTAETSGAGLPDDPATLERMAAAYAGPFLADLAVPEELEEFSDWLRGWRTYLHERAVRLLTRLAEIHEERGDTETALEHGQRLLAIAPHHEAGHRRVMTLLARRGQTNAALRHYDQCRNHLAQELGVHPEEATRQLRDHILEGRVGVDSPRPPSAEPTPALLTPERRQVTILACTLDPAGTRDPEARAAALGEAVARVRACLEEHAGHVVHSHGGALLAYFGFPSAREDSPRRALAAARAVLTQTDTGMEVQLGVHSEVLVTGTDPDVPDPGGLATERTLALRNRAPARTALVSPELHHLAPDGFAFHELPGGDLRLMESAPAPETGPGQAPATAPFVGREAQLSWLSDMARWTRTAGFRGVLLQGEAGVGKTRLVEALAARLTRENFEVRTFACRAELSGRPFHPVVETLADLAGVDLEAGIPAIHAALTDYLAEFTDLPEAAPGLLLRLLARAPRAQVADLPDDPRQERAELQETLLALLAQLAGHRPVLLILEDIHWADSATLELTRELSRRLEGAPLFLAATARPPLPAEWPPSAWEVLPVPPLAPAASRALLEALAPGWQLSAARQADILAQAEGIPLFLEEMVRASVAGDPADGEAATIPASLRDLLWARLEQLGNAKRLAQIAAALGREFRADWLVPITALEGPTVAAQLEMLESAGFLDRREHRDGTRFRFRHALYQEAAYASQLLRDRIAAHGRITTALLEQWPETARRQPDLVAHHAHEAEQWLTALGYSLTAGNAALEAAAPAEALTHFRHAETLAMETLAAAAPEDQRVKALVGVGLASLSLYGYGAEEANRAFHQAQELAGSDTEATTRFTILWGLWLGASSRSGYGEAEVLARQLHAMASSMAAPPFLVSAHYALTNTRFMTGDLESALHHHEQARAAYRPQDHGVLVGTFGENTLATTLAIAAWARCLSGRPQAAERGLAADLEWTESLNHPHTLAYLLTFGAMTAFYRGDPDAVAERTGRLLALASANGFALWQAAGTALEGWVRAARGEAEGMEQVETSLAGMRQAMAGVGTPFLALLTDGYLRLGDRERARRAAEETEGNITRIGDIFYLPEVLRVRGLTAATAEEATALLQQAVDQARQTGTLLLELRAATDLAARGRPEPLRAAWHRLPADEDSPDIRAAHAALADS